MSLYLIFGDIKLDTIDLYIYIYVRMDIVTNNISTHWYDQNEVVR